MLVIILSGIPGSGKSYWANRIYPDAQVCSADDFFTYSTQPDVCEYRFDPAKLGEAHDYCFRKFARLVYRDVASDAIPSFGTVIVDNTNIRMFEIAPYYRMAQAFKHEVQIRRFLCDPLTACTRNVHGVPYAKVAEMAQSFDPLPPWWKISYHFTEDSK